jgi:hypothetical protein
VVAQRSMSLALFNTCIENLARKIANELGLSISHERNDYDRFRGDDVLYRKFTRKWFARSCRDVPKGARRIKQVDYLIGVPKEWSLTKQQCSHCPICSRNAKLEDVHSIEIAPYWEIWKAGHQR